MLTSLLVSMDRIYVHLVSVYVLAARIVHSYVVLDSFPYECIYMTEVTWRVEEDAAIKSETAKPMKVEGTMQRASNNYFLILLHRIVLQHIGHQSSIKSRS
jgi:hypothetical protein